MQRELEAPYVPSQTEENFDTRLNLANDPWKDANSEALQQGALMLKSNATQMLFDEYFFDIREQKMGQESSATNV